jgi:hypothetical protein
MSSHFCRVGKIIPNLSKLVNIEKLENRLIKFVEDSENKPSKDLYEAI